MRHFFLLLLLFTGLNQIFAQIPGEDAPPLEDSLMVFESPRPLVNKQEIKGLYNNAAGLNLTFSNSGFGAGPFYERRISENMFLRFDLYIGALRSSDEFPQYTMIDTNVFDYVIPNKVNWLFTMPLTVGLSYNLFSDLIFESFKPFLSAGIGPTFLLAVPYGEYPHSFFDQLKYSKFYTRFGGYVGLGANFGGGASATSFHVRYYYTPFGGDGIYSVSDRPIKNIGGGLYLALSIGWRF